MRRFPRVAAIGVGSAALLLVLVVVELGFFVYDWSRDPVIEIEKDPETYTPGRENHVRYRANGEAIFDVTYSLDAAGNRITPQTTTDANKWVVFLGGSYTFGEGVEDDETLPAVVSDSLPEWQVANRGHGGFGTANVLQMLQRPESLGFFEGKETALVYVFIPGHVRRSIGSMHVVTGWGADYPLYSVDDDRVRLEGTFSEVRRFRHRFYRVLSKEPILKHFNVDLPPVFSPEHLRFTARLILECRAVFLETFSGQPFVVVIYPTRGDPQDARKIVPYLDALGIRYLDYSGAFEGQREGMSFPFDGHPTAEAHRIIGTRLAGDLVGILDGE